MRVQVCSLPGRLAGRLLAHRARDGMMSQVGWMHPSQHYSLSSRMLVLDVRIHLKVKRLYRVAGEY